MGRLKVLTFNIHHGEGTDKRLDLERIAAVIEESEAEIVGLNEVDRVFGKRSGFVDQLAWLAERLRMNAAFCPSIRRKKKGASVAGAYGNALLAKFPILQTRCHLLSKYPPGVEPRTLLCAKLDVQGTLFTVFVTHLSYLKRWRTKELDALRRLLAGSTQQRLKRTVFMGDLNLRTNSQELARIGSELRDTWDPANGEGCTFPSRFPRFRIDYILATPDLSVVRTQTGSSHPEASDHLPLSCVLSFP
ncbi:endonuclease/exonuclease/phosphatase family protein [Bacillaceae bacterium]